MPSDSQIHQFRWIERILLFLALGFTGVFVWLFVTNSLAWYAVFGGIGILVLLLMMLLFVQHKIDVMVEISISQAGYLQDDVFSSLYENSPVAYLSILNDGTIIDSNPAAVKLLGGQVSTMEGSNIFSLMQGTDEIDPGIVQGKVAAGLTMKGVEVVIQPFVGTPLWVELSVYNHRVEGQRLMELVDVTEQKRIDTAKSEFVALATHQLRTPIAAIRWNVELLSKNLTARTEKQGRYLDKIERNVFRMISLINDFLSVSKLEMGTFAAQSEDTNLTEFFTSIEDEFAEKITSKQLTVNRQDDPPNLVIKTDSRLFHIIVSNLVTNAVKYLVPNGTLVFSYQLIGEQLQIVVADNGIGIPESELDNLFTKFFRASNARSHQTEGTGLGLYVVKQSVELLGGTITVDSKENEGARFVIILPVQVVSYGKIR